MSGRGYSLCLCNIFALIILGAFVSFASPAAAQQSDLMSDFLVEESQELPADDLLINEIYSTTDSSCDKNVDPNCAKEWVELFNPTSEAIDLSKYLVKDGSGTSKKPLGIIEAMGYYVLETTSGWLNNAGDSISLIRIDDVSLVDTLVYGNWDDNQDSQPPAPGAQESLSRLPNGVDSGDDLLDFRLAPISKGTENILPSYSNDLLLNEILPQPIDGSAMEFIELYNSAEIELELGGWWLDDAADAGSAPWVIPKGTIIAAKDYLIFYNSQTKISLNDGGDCVFLYDPNNVQKQTICYQPAPKAYSFSRFGDDWSWSSSATPLAVNLLTVETVELEPEVVLPLITIGQAKAMEAGEDVKVSGRVLVVNGVLSEQYLYISDQSGGIQVYCYKKSFPALSLGTEIVVTGEISEYFGEKRIKISQSSDVVVLSGPTAQKPVKTGIGDLGEEDVGSYFEIEGEISQTSGSTFVVSSASGEIKVVIKEGTGIEKPRMKQGIGVRISGILSSYKGELRILPFLQEGVTILTSGLLPTTGADFSKELVWNISQKAPNRQPKLSLRRQKNCWEVIPYYWMVI